MKKAVERFFWGLYAYCYDGLNEFRPYRKMLEEVMNELAPTNSWRILDAGCGTGNLEALLIEREVRAELVAVDFSVEMIKKAKAKYANAVSFGVADLNDPLPYQSERFNGVICVNAAYNLDRPENAIREFARILKTGGVLVLVTPKKGSSPTLILKSHRHENESESKWQKNTFIGWLWLILRVFGLTTTAIKFALIALFNKRLFKTMTTFKGSELEAILQRSGFVTVCSRLTYGDQCLIVKAVKEVSDD